MRDNYDFTNAIKNPYSDRLKKQITIRLDDTVIAYFKEMADQTGMPYQNIINYYLLDCVKNNKKMKISCWLGFDFKRAVRHVGEASFANVSLLYEFNIIQSIKMPLSMVQPNPYGTCVYCSYEIDSTSDTDSVYS